MKCHFVLDGIEMDVTGGYLPRALNLILGEEFSLSNSEKGSPSAVCILLLSLLGATIPDPA